MSKHIVKSYDRDLEFLDRHISEMGGIAEKMLAESMEALSGLNTELASRVVASDARLDDLKIRIEENAIATIGRRQPLAIDLRECIGSIRICGNIERIGDLAKNIARRTLLISSDTRVPGAIVGLRSMYELAATQLKDAIDAYSARDIQSAKSVWESDADLDALEDSVFRDLLTFMMEDPRNISFCTHLLFCSKNLERIGDHTTNISETVVYVVTGDAKFREQPQTDINAMYWKHVEAAQ